jgi:MFS family permease
MPAACWILAAAIGAALHVGKLPPALPLLERDLGVTLVLAGFLLSMVQFAGMLFGLLTGLAVQRLGLRRSMVAGLFVLAAASALGALAHGAAWLLATRALEGLGFLWVVLPGPGLLRMFVPTHRINRMMGIWGTYMPLGTSLALLLGPWVMRLGSPDSGWRWWWCILSVVALGFGLALLLRVPPDRSQYGRTAIPPHGQTGEGLLRLTLSSGPVWLLALSFGMYSGQWLAVVGFLPSIYAKAGIAATTASWLTAIAAGFNIIGNVAAGRLLERGTGAVSLLATGFIVMGSGAMLAFSTDLGPWWKYAAILAFSAVGGLIPGTLFSLALRLAPGPKAVATTVGWMQQWSSTGQFMVPPLMAWVAVTAGGWQWTGWVSACFCALGLVLAALISRELIRHQRAQPYTRD